MTKTKKPQPLNDYTAEDQALWDTITGPGLYDVVGRPAVSYLTWKRLDQVVCDRYNRKKCMLIGDEEDIDDFTKQLREDLGDDVEEFFYFSRAKEDRRIGEDIPISLRSEEDAWEIREAIANENIGAVVLLYQGNKLQHLDKIEVVPTKNRGLKRLPIYHVREFIEVDEEGRAHHKKKSFTKVGNGITKPAVISTSREFSKKDFDAPEVMLEVSKSKSPVLYHPSAGEIHAYRGVGKTNFTVGLLNAFATGSEFLCYKATRCFRTIDFDGEMDGGDLQESLSLLAEENDNFHMVARCEQPDNFMPSIATTEGLHWYEEAIVRAKAEVVVFDNWSTLANSTTNEEEAFLVFSEWCRKMRLRGVTVIYLHHDGKDKHTQRGHSKPEDPLNWVIGLTWPNGYEGQEQLKLILKFEKCRRPVREHNRIAVTLEPDGTWCWGKDIESAKPTSGRPHKLPTTDELSQLKQLVADGKGERMIAEEMKISRALVRRWKNDLLGKKPEQGDISFDSDISPKEQGND
jgi:KaiC/GvpD/RAD55 family RecA-like ATPase